MLFSNDDLNIIVNNNYLYFRKNEADDLFVGSFLVDLDSILPEEFQSTFRKGNCSFIEPYHVKEVSIDSYC